jgi:hypothetical protein
VTGRSRINRVTRRLQHRQRLRRANPLGKYRDAHNVQVIRQDDRRIDTKSMYGLNRAKRFA